MWIVNGEEIIPVDGWALSLSPDLVKELGASIDQYKELFEHYDSGMGGNVDSKNKQETKTKTWLYEDELIGEWVQIGYYKSFSDYVFTSDGMVKNSGGQTAPYEIHQGRITVRWSDRIVDVFSLKDGILTFIERYHLNGPEDWAERIGIRYKKGKHSEG